MKKLFSVILILISLMTVCSCQSKSFYMTAKYELPSEIRSISSGTVAENENYILTYDSSVDNLILFCKKDSSIVSTIPYEYYSSKEEVIPYVAGKLNSSVVISCVNNDNSSVTDYFSFDSVIEKNTCYSVKIKNGVRVVYFFSEPEISIPVDYTLTDKGLKAEILVSEITEGSSHRVYKLSLLPYFASAENNTDSYLFVPSGSGALMYTDSGKRDVRIYSEPVYGEDATYDTVYSLNKTEQVYLPCFGAKNESLGVFAVISNGSELGCIEASAGEEQLGYSSSYASFYLRARDIAKIKNSSGANQVVEKIGDYITSQESICVDYYLLNGDASYNAMAKLYRNILSSKSDVSKDESENYLVLDILGGAAVDKSFLGIAYKKTCAATTLTQAREIIYDVQNNVNCGFSAVLKGYTQGGLDKSAVGGGFKPDSSLGTVKQLKALANDCLEGNVQLAMDFDLVYFSKSGSGYSVSSDSAKTLNNTSAKSNKFTLVTNEIDSSAQKLYLLKRSLTSSAVEKAISAAEKYGLRGIALSTLSNTCYGDYRSSEYFVKANTVSDFEALSERLKSADKFTVSYSANAYAAVNSDIVCDAPTSSSQYFSLDKDIPFYQMIFKGSRTVSSHSLNTQADLRKEFLKAIQCGSALKFSVISEFDSDFISSPHSSLAGSVYDDIKSKIFELTAEALPFLKSVNGAQINEFSESGGLTCTVFDNGITVYVNFNNSAVNTPIGTAEPYGFVYTEKGE